MGVEWALQRGWVCCGACCAGFGAGDGCGVGLATRVGLLWGLLCRVWGGGWVWSGPGNVGGFVVGPVVQGLALRIGVERASQRGWVCCGACCAGFGVGEGCGAGLATHAPPHAPAPPHTAPAPPDPASPIVTACRQHISARDTHRCKLNPPIRADLITTGERRRRTLQRCGRREGAESADSRRPSNLIRLVPAQGSRASQSVRIQAAQAGCKSGEHFPLL